MENNLGAGPDLNGTAIPDPLNPMNHISIGWMVRPLRLDILFHVSSNLTSSSGQTYKAELLLLLPPGANPQGKKEVDLINSNRINLRR